MPAVFPSQPPISVVLGRAPNTRDARLYAMIPYLLRQEATALQRELGAPIRIVDSDPGHGSRWLMGPGLGMTESRKPHILMNRTQRLLITDAVDVRGVFETFGLLRSLHRLPDGLYEVDDLDIEACKDRIRIEVGDTWPSFGLRGIDWAAVCARHREASSIVDLQVWLAELHDAHTRIVPAGVLGRLPYEVRVADASGPAVFWRVPKNSVGYRAGLRPGMTWGGVPTANAWRLTPGAPHAKPWLVGRALLQGPIDHPAEIVAHGQGQTIRFTERYTDPYARPVAVSGVGNAAYLRIDAWLPDAPVHDALDEVLTADALIVDLRGNGGGNLALAWSFRDRFLDRPRQVGWIRWSKPGGGLADPEKLVGGPEGRGWGGKPVVFLTDPLTYSASEDALLGLQGQPNVKIVGAPSGGGSGRLRVLRMTPGWRLRISSALTYDTRWRCVEGHGIPVDIAVRPERPSEEDPVLSAALRALSA